MRTPASAGLWLPLFLLLALAPLGCASQTTSNVAVGEILEGEEGEALQKDYIIKDRSLSKEIDVLDVKARFMGDFLEGQAVLQNRKKYTVPFEFRVDWFDGEGYPIDSNVGLWKPEILYGGETKWITAICPKPGARGFKFMIRNPNPVEN